MEKNPSHSPDSHSSNPSQMDALPPLAADDSSVLWDWGDLLDFNDDLPLPISLDDWPRSPLPENSPSPPPPPVEEPPGSSGVDRRVRKRDPRLTCANFLAGRVPCACPEVDAKLLEEEEGTPGKKRTRTARASRDAAAAATKTKATGVGIVRCQVPECQADIRELKGYHRRHRVCLRCANASAVVLDGESKRYCQQCGKFHVLSDFDEGKRSCRRKLERHNNRRRRKTSDSKSPVEKESQVDTPDEDGSCENEAGQDSQVGDGEALLGPEATDLQTLCSDPVSQNIQNESVLSFMASGVEQLDEAKHNSRYTHSSACGDNKSTYSSLCATGRISFKLYDWNPAEFPRRLRHQIFQWLASMPVELEGYIRPGCTILTAFIAMPTFVWHKLLEDPASYLQNLVVAPQGMLSGRGRFHVHLNDEIFYFGKDLYGTSIREVEAKAHTPQLHYVEPICFEAGHPMEFVACGSYLNQTKFRFLISFAGKYLEPDYCVAAQHCEVGRGTDFSCEHEVYRIFIANTEPGVFGPAFIEVENESGLSNFLPILIGNGEVCSEVKRLLQNYDSSLCLTKMQVLATVSWPCEVSVTRVAAISEFLLDIAWLLRQPTLENVQCLLNFSWIQRFNCILSFLLKNECILILKNVLRYMEVLMDWDSFSNDTSNDDMSLLQSYMVQAKEIIQKRFPKDRVSVPDSGRYAPKRGYSSESCSADVSLHRHPTMKQDVELRKDAKLGVVCGATILKSTEVVPLLDKQVVMNVNSEEEWPKKSYSGIFSMKLMGTRPLVFVAATAAVCFGMCTVIYHPHKVGEFVVTIRRCLFDGV